MMLQHGLSEDSSYTINQSLRLRASNSAYLSRTFGTPTSTTLFTESYWLKRGTLSTTQYLSAGFNASGEGLFFSASNQIGVVRSGTVILLSNAVYRDSSSHMHIQIASDIGNVSAAARVRIYVNGAEITSWVTDLRASYTSWTVWNTAVLHYIGASNAGAVYLDTYLSEIVRIDGQALDPSAFGQTDPTTGIWVPKKYTGTYGTNGFYLPFNDATSLTTLGYDRSGNGNNWTCIGISITAGATYDVMKDSPTNGAGEVGNYATLNPLYTGRSTLTNGNLTASGTTDLPTIIPDSGTWYFEIGGVSKAWTPPAAFPSAVGDYNFGQRPFTNTPTHPRMHTGNLPDATPVTTSGTFTGNASTDGPCIFINGTPTAMTINSNAVTFATHADKLAGGFKVRSSSASYNASGTNTYSITTNSGKFKNARAQANP